MPLFHEDTTAPSPTVTVDGSVAVELEWTLASAVRQDFRRDHAALARIYEERPELAERVRSFWDPDEETTCGGSIELIVLAHHGGLVFSTDAAELIGRLDELCATAPVDPPLRSESEEDRKALLRRLRRLRDSAETRKRYVALIRDVWSAVSEDWQRDGVQCVSAAVDSRREVLRRGGSWREVSRSSCQVSETEAELVEALGPDGVVAVVPAFFAHLGCWVDLPGMQLIGVRADGSGIQARARTELLARRLKTISDPTRLAMLEALRGSPRTVGELAGLFSLAQPTVSNHVKVLREAGIVANGANGERRKLVVQPDVLTDLLEHLQGILAVSEPSQ